MIPDTKETNTQSIKNMDTRFGEISDGCRRVRGGHTKRDKEETFASKIGIERVCEGLLDCKWRAGEVRVSRRR